MVLTPEEIIKRIQEPEAGEIITKASRLSCDLKLHVKGEGYESWLIKQAKDMETEKTLSKKKKLCRPKTPRIYQGVKKQYAKIFRAKGSIRSYKFKDGNSQLVDELKSILSNISYGLSMQQYMQSTWFDAFIEEPNGFIGVELKPANELKDQTKEEPFLQFYPICQIHDYCYKGSELQYIILKTEIIEGEEELEGYRVIDDKTDTIYIKNSDGSISLHKEKVQIEGESDDVILRPNVYPNKFKKIPFIQISNFKAGVDDDDYKINHIAKSLPNAESYLSLSDDHTISVKYHQRPMFYSYPVTCQTCNGSKNIKTSAGEMECNTCKGSGWMSALKADLTQGISLPMADKYEEDGFPAAAAPAGYITPDLQSLAEQRTEMKDEQDNIEYACLGVVGVLAKDTVQTTATKAILDLEPLVDTLSEISFNAEIVEEYLTDRIGEVVFKDSYEGSMIQYGRIYFLKSVNELFAEYKSAKESGASEGQLKEILRTINYMKFENDPKAELRSQMLLDLEPMPTKTITEVVTVLNGMSQETLNLKVNFLDLVTRFEKEYGLIESYKKDNPNVTYLTKVEEIKTKLYEYAKEISGISTSPQNRQGNQTGA